MKKCFAIGFMMAMTSLSFADNPTKCAPLSPPLNDLAVQKFAELAALKSFTYDFKGLPEQLLALESCYTQTGWHSFSLALQRAGNVDIAKKNKLYVHAERIGKVKTLDKQAETDTWRVLVPIKVTYNNDTQSLTQHLDVKLLVNIDNNKLGVEQITASPSFVIDKPQKTTPPKDKETPQSAKTNDKALTPFQTETHRVRGQNTSLTPMRAQKDIKETVTASTKKDDAAGPTAASKPDTTQNNTESATSNATTEGSISPVNEELINTSPSESTSSNS